MKAQEIHEMAGVLRILRRQRAEAIVNVPVVGEKLEVPTSDGKKLETWLHRAPIVPAEGAGEDGTPVAPPLLVTLHGGGFCLGDARRTDALGEWIAAAYGMCVIDVSYRLAPENPWPAALHDVLDVLDYAAAQADRLGVDASRVYLMGCSAGANLAVTASLASEERPHAYELSGVIAHYGAYNLADWPSHGGREMDVNADLAAAYNVWYLGEGDPRNPLVSPIFASDAQLAGLPPVHQYPVVGDSLYADSERLYERLQALGAHSVLVPIEGAYHGYVEDAANVSFYEAISFPEAREARPANYVELAEKAVRASLEGFIGAPVAEAAFCGYKA